MIELFENFKLSIFFQFRRQVNIRTNSITSSLSFLTAIELEDEVVFAVSDGQ